MLTIEEIATRLQDRNLSKVADGVELSYPTVWNVARGEMASYETVKKLSDYLEANP
jgi:hypothetical protein